MRRAFVFVSALVVVPLGLLTGVRIAPATAEDATPPTEGQGFVGSWRVVVTAAQEPPVQSLTTFGADGTLIVSDPPVVPRPGAPGEVVFTSAGHGAWAATGPDTAILTFAEIGADAQGTLLGILTVRVRLTLGADGQTWRGEGDSTFADPAGNKMGTVRVTVQATRIVAEAPAEAGTPAA